MIWYNKTLLNQIIIVMNRWDVTFGIAFALLLGFMLYEMDHDKPTTCIDAGSHWIDIDKLDRRCAK